MFNRKKKQISLYFIITIIISLCMITPCIIAGSYFYITLKNNTLDSIKQTLNTSADRAFSSLDSTLHSVKNTYYSIISDPIINPELYNHIFPGKNVSSSESIDERLTKMMFFSTIWNEGILTSITLTNDLKSFHYISNTKYGEFLDPENSYSLDTITNNWKELSKSFKNSRINILQHSLEHSENVFYIRDYYGYPDGEFKGLLSFQLNEQVIMSVFNEFDNYTSTLCFAYDDSGTVVMSSNSSIQNGTISKLSVNGTSLETMMADSDRYLVKTTVLKSFPLNVCVLIPLDPIYVELQQQLNGYMIIFFSLLLIVIIIAFIASKFVSGYIDLLIKRMTLLSHGNYSQTLPVHGIIELNNLSTAFTNMSEKIQSLLNEKYANEVLLKESELKALQAQINPHFLFNTLLSISWKARANQDMECYELITALSSLLKANIYTPTTKFITLKEELQNIQYYLQLQKSRFGPKFSYDIDVDTRLMEQPILKLCLQPLVENAAIHGLENKIENGTILITGDLIDNHEMLIQIIDNGIGFNPEDLNKKRDATSSKNSMEKGHQIGLTNTHLRLKYTYGDQYGLTIASSPERGTTVSVRLPMS